MQSLRQDVAYLDCLLKLPKKSATSAGGLGQQDVGHAGIATGSGDLSLRSPVQQGFSVADASLSVQTDLLNEEKKIDKVTGELLK